MLVKYFVCPLKVGRLPLNLPTFYAGIGFLNDIGHVLQGLHHRSHRLFFNFTSVSNCVSKINIPTICLKKGVLPLISNLNNKYLFGDSHEAKLPVQQVGKGKKEVILVDDKPGNQPRIHIKTKHQGR